MNATLRRNLMLGTAGHVDHGKSALVKLLTGCETDTLAEEKQRGLTIDLGFAPCQLANQRVVGIVDVPGHVDFIRNMVAGAHGIDVVILVVAADDGIMPQTQEHLHILTLMGLRHGLVALTKIDLVDAARRDFVIADLRRLLAGTFLRAAPVCPLSNLTGEGFDAFFDALNQTVDGCGDRPCRGPFRMWVEDAFSIRGAGTVVTGIPTHGCIRPGDAVTLVPAGLTGHVRKMQVYGADALEGRAGECVALNIPELESDAVRRGMALAAAPAPSVAMAEAELRILDSVAAKVDDYLEVQLHAGTAAVPANVALLEGNPMIGGQKQFVQLRFQAPLPLVAGERFVVRANLAGPAGPGLATIGGGQILGLTNARLRRQKPWTLARLAARRDAVDDPVRWCEQLVRESEAPASVETLRPHCWSRDEEIAAALGQLQGAGRLVPRGPGQWLLPERIRQCAGEIMAAVEEFHAANPQRAGMSSDELRARLKTHPDYLAAALESLAQARRLETRDGWHARAGWHSRLPAGDQEMCDQIARRLQAARWAPPGLTDLAADLGQPAPRVAALAKLLAERGLIIRLDEALWMHRDAVESAKDTALTLFRRRPAFSTMQFRDALGVSRKFAVPLADYLDKTRFTVRAGNQRTPGADAKKRLACAAANAEPLNGKGIM